MILGEEVLLVVRLQQGAWPSKKAESAGEESEELRRKAMQDALLKSGCRVAGRFYEFFAVKDAGKMANWDDGGRVGRDKETLYFLATDGPSADATRLAASFPGSGRHSWKSVEEGWGALACFTDGTKTVAKMAARLELAFSGTSPVFGDASWHVHRDLRVPGDGSWASVYKAALEADRRRPNQDAKGINVIEVDDLFGTAPPDEGGGATGNAVETDGPHSLAEMTDGTGLISMDLAHEMARELSWIEYGGVPCLMQARVWYDGSVGKGTLLASAKLPSRTICLRASQVKVHGSPSIDGPAPGYRIGCEGIVEVNRRQHSDPNTASLGSFLAPLLELGGGTPMADALLRIQKTAAEGTSALRQKVSLGHVLSKDDKAALLRQMEFLPELEDDLASQTSAADLLFAGFDGRDEHTRAKVLNRLNQTLLKLAQGKFSIPDSYSLMVTADPSSSIPEGSVVCLVKGVPLVRSRVLLYKSPGLHPGDVRSAKAIEMPPELAAHLQAGSESDGSRVGQTCLIFSTRGSRPMADMIAGSDYDGDVFSIIYNEEIVSHWPSKDFAPWEEPAASSRHVRSPSKSMAPPELPPAALTGQQLRAKLRVHLMHCRKANGVMSLVAISWKVWAHERGAGCDEARRLSWLYMQALDASKASALPNLPPSLQRTKPADIPYHLKTKDIAIDSSMAKRQAAATSLLPKQSVLLRLWNAVATDTITGIEVPQRCPRLWTDDELHVYRIDGKVRARFAGDDSEKWRTRLDKWRRRGEEYGQKASRCKLPNGKFDATAWKQLIQHYRNLLLGAGQGDGGRNLYDVTDPCNDLRLEASALYFAFYGLKASKACGWCRSCISSNQYERKLTFPWAVAGDILSELRIRNHEAAKPGGQQRAPMAVDREVLAAMLRRQKHKAESTAERMATEDADDDDLALNAIE